MRYPTQPTTDQGNIIGSRLANEIEHRFDGDMRILSKGDQIDSSLAELLAGTTLVFNVKSYGAAVGSPDNAAAFQEALDAAALVNGEVSVPSGTYSFDTGLTIASNVALVGQGFGSKLKFSWRDVTQGTQAYIANASVAGNEGFAIRNLSIFGPQVETPVGAGTNRVHGIILTRCTNVTIEGVQIADVRGFGMNIRGLKKSRITNNFINGVAKDGITLFGWENSTDGGADFGVEDVVIANNTVHGTGDDCIAVHCSAAVAIATTLRPTRISIVGNTCVQRETTDANSQGTGVKLTGVEDCSVVGNTIDHTWDESIFVRDDDVVTGTLRSLDVVIASNTCRRAGEFNGSAQEGIRVNTSDRVSVVGNVITDPTLDGINIATNADETLVSGNIVWSAGQFGIQVTGDTVGNTAVKGNFVSFSFSAGIRINDAPGTIVSDNVSINNNTDNGSGESHAGIVLREAQTYIVTGNFCSDTRPSSKTQDYGIGVITSPDTIFLLGNVCIGNDVADYGIAAVPATTFVRKGNVNIGDCDTGGVVTLADDATPSVQAANAFKTGGTTTITDFDDGVVNQEITILSAHAITITDGTNILLNGSVNYVMAAGDTLTLRMFNDQVWEETSRKVNL